MQCWVSPAPSEATDRHGQTAVLYTEGKSNMPKFACRLPLSHSRFLTSRRSRVLPLRPRRAGSKYCVFYGFPRRQDEGHFPETVLLLAAHAKTLHHRRRSVVGF